MRLPAYVGGIFSPFCPEFLPNCLFGQEKLHSSYTAVQQLSHTHKREREKKNKSRSTISLSTLKYPKLSIQLPILNINFKQERGLLFEELLRVRGVRYLRRQIQIFYLQRTERRNKRTLSGNSVNFFGDLRPPLVSVADKPRFHSGLLEDEHETRG